MGTNYYLHYDCCPYCGRPEEVEHIGKSSGGWCFALHVTDKIYSLRDWQLEWEKPNTKIFNEYGERISSKQMLIHIIKRGWEGNRTRGEGYPPPGYISWDDFFNLNSAEIGPNNLLRHKVDGVHCVGHGEGTYDYITGDFS